MTVRHIFDPPNVASSRKSALNKWLLLIEAISTDRLTMYGDHETARSYIE